MFELPSPRTKSPILAASNNSATNARSRVNGDLLFILASSTEFSRKAQAKTGVSKSIPAACLLKTNIGFSPH